MNQLFSAMVLTAIHLGAPMGTDMLPDRPLLSQERRFARDIDCGPRCAWYMLQQNGHTEIALESVLATFHDLDRLQGYSLLDLRDVLRRYNVDMVAARVESADELRGSVPVILHLRRPLDPEHDLSNGVAAPEALQGHFVVWLGRRGALHHIWDGPMGVRGISPSALDEVISGVSLAPATARIATDTSPNGIVMLGSGIAVAIIGAGLIWRGVRTARLHY